MSRVALHGIPPWSATPASTLNRLPKNTQLDSRTKESAALRDECDGDAVVFTVPPGSAGPGLGVKGQWGVKVALAQVAVPTAEATTLPSAWDFEEGDERSGRARWPVHGGGRLRVVRAAGSTPGNGLECQSGGPDADGGGLGAELDVGAFGGVAAAVAGDFEASRTGLPWTYRCRCRMVKTSVTRIAAWELGQYTSAPAGKAPL